MSVESLTALIVAIAALLGHLPAVITLLQHIRSPAATAHPAALHARPQPPVPPVQ